MLHIFATYIFLGLVLIILYKAYRDLSQSSKALKKAIQLLIDENKKSEDAMKALEYVYKEWGEDTYSRLVYENKKLKEAYEELEDYAITTKNAYDNLKDTYKELEDFNKCDLQNKKTLIEQLNQLMHQNQ